VLSRKSSKSSTVPSFETDGGDGISSAVISGSSRKFNTESISAITSVLLFSLRFLGGGGGIDSSSKVSLIVFFGGTSESNESSSSISLDVLFENDAGESSTENSADGTSGSAYLCIGVGAAGGGGGGGTKDCFAGAGAGGGGE